MQVDRWAFGGLLEFSMVRDTLLALVMLAIPFMAFCCHSGRGFSHPMAAGPGVVEAFSC